MILADTTESPNETIFFIGYYLYRRPITYRLLLLKCQYFTQSTEQEGEFSCGWGHLPLFQQDGVPAQNKLVSICARIQNYT